MDLSSTFELLREGGPEVNQFLDFTSSLVRGIVVVDPHNHVIRRLGTLTELARCFFVNRLNKHQLRKHLQDKLSAKMRLGWW